MGRRRRYSLSPGLIAALVAAVAATVGLLTLVIVRPWSSGEQATTQGTPAESQKPAAAPDEPRRIRATLFYVSADGMRLVTLEREVPYGEGTVEQARWILEEQLKPAPSGYASAIPRGTRLRAVFMSGRGEAFVDLSREVEAGHIGGSLTEAFTVYSIVNALTANLPAISSVQVLVEGREVDTLAGHIDLRHPLHKNLKWVEKPETP